AATDAGAAVRFFTGRVPSDVQECRGGRGKPPGRSWTWRQTYVLSSLLFHFKRPNIRPLALEVARFAAGQRLAAVGGREVEAGVDGRAVRQWAVVLPQPRVLHVQRVLV